MPVTKPFIKIFGTRENTRAGFMPSTIVWRWSIHKQFWIEFELSINQIICANNCHIMRILCKIERDAVQVSFINYTKSLEPILWIWKTHLKIESCRSFSKLTYKLTSDQRDFLFLKKFTIYLIIIDNPLLHNVYLKF